MPRRICLPLAASLALAGCTLAHSQDAPDNNAAASPTNASAPSEDDVAKLQAENALLKKEVADAARTIAQLQAKLAQAGKSHEAATATAEPPAAANSPDVTDNGAPSTNAAPAGPMRALPLDATNANVTAAAPAANAGPSRSYTVVKGDSLWKIAHKMYPGDTLNGEDKIREANKDVFNGKFLQPGQVLVIPQ